MDLTAQIYFLWTLVLANGHHLPGFGPPGHRDPDRPDIIDPLHLHPHRGPFDHHHPRLGFGPYRRDHGMLEEFLDPLIGNPNEGSYNQNDIRITTDNTPLKVNLLSEAPQNNTIHEKAVDEKLKNKEDVISIGNNNTQPIKNDMPSTLPAKEEKILKPNGNKNVMPPPLPAKEEQILRTNENKTVTPKPINNQILESNDITAKPVKPNVIQEKKHSGDSIVFPDNVEEMKSKLNDKNDNMNKTSNPVTNNNNLNGTDHIDMTKNRDGAFDPVQTVPINPVQGTNDKFLLVPINPSGNALNQPLPITNDVFPNRSPVYTTVRPGQGPLYTSVVNAVPFNVQPSGAWNNGKNNNYQNPGLGVSPNPTYNTAVNNPNGNNWNPNVSTLNPNLSSNMVNNSPVPSNSVEIPTMMFNPQPSTNGYNNQPTYNNQQGTQYPARNVQDNGSNQQTIPSGVVPTYNNVQGSGPQGIGNQNTVPNYSGNNGQTYIPVNVGTNNNLQSNPNGQQFYILSNNQPNNNMNTGQPTILNTQGNAINSNPNNGNNNQQYILVNANQLNAPQNGQGNNIYALQNGQLVALIPVQLSNGALVNNNNVNVNQMTPINGNVGQPNTLLPTMNSQPNLVTFNSNPNQPNQILINGNVPNNYVLLNGQTSNLNGQISVPSGSIILNGQNSVPNGAIILNTQNVLGNGQTPLVNNGRNLYTMVTVPNNYVRNVGSNPSLQVPPPSANLVNTRDKADKEDSSAAGNNAT